MKREWENYTEAQKDSAWFFLWLLSDFHGIFNVVFPEQHQPLE